MSNRDHIPLLFKDKVDTDDDGVYKDSVAKLFGTQFTEIPGMPGHWWIMAYQNQFRISCMGEYPNGTPRWNIGWSCYTDNRIYKKKVLANDPKLDVYYFQTDDDVEHLAPVIRKFMTDNRLKPKLD